MKPAWDDLGKEYNADSSSVLIGDVDCTEDEGKELCNDFEVRGYPTIKYFVDGDTTTGQDYQGGRDLDSLRSFVQDKLDTVFCNVKTGEDCSDKEKTYLEKYKVKSVDDIQSQLDRLDKMKQSSMKAELKKWLFQRLRILTSLLELKGEGEL